MSGSGSRSCWKHHRGEVRTNQAATGRLSRGRMPCERESVSVDDFYIVMRYKYVCMVGGADGCLDASWRPTMTLTRNEQHALLRIERSLRRDHVLRMAMDKFNRGCPHGREPVRECLSPWYPLRWRVGFIALLALTVGFIALVTALTVHAV